MANAQRTHRVKLALQGGGAKIVDIAAAVEAFQRAPNIEITAVSGTSAGSIVAVLLAAGVDMTDFRDWLKEHGERWVKRVAPRRNTLTSATRIVFGQSVFPKKQLETFVSTLVEDLVRSKDLSITMPLHVTYADLQSQKSRCHSIEATTAFETSDWVDLVNWVAASCSIPFAFVGTRTAKIAPFVDGGLCNNLPTEELFSAQDDDHIVAITFTDNEIPEKPQSTIGYAVSLLDAAITHSVNRSKAGIPEAQICSLQSSNTTVGFRRALRDGLGSPYTLQQKTVADWIDGTLLPSLNVDEAPENQLMPIGEYERRIWDSYKALTRNAPHLAIVSTTMVVTGYSLLASDNEEVPREDEVRICWEVIPKNEPLYAFNTSVGSLPPESSDSTLEYKAWDSSFCEHSVIVLPAQKREGDKLPLRRFILFFDPPLRPMEPEAPYTIEQKNYQRGGISGLSDPEKKHDQVYMVNKRPETIQNFSIIIHVPKAYADATLVEYENGTKENYQTGRQLTAQEIASTQVTAPAHFESLGWISENVKSNQIVGCRIKAAT